VFEKFYLGADPFRHLVGEFLGVGNRRAVTGILRARNKTWRPVETTSVSVSLNQRVRAKLEKMASVPEPEVTNNSFQRVDMFKAHACDALFSAGKSSVAGHKRSIL
jgi:hypothetical protein